MSRLKQVTEQMVVNFSTSSLGILFHSLTFTLVMGEKRGCKVILPKMEMEG